LNKTKPIDTKALIEKAKTSRDKEAYEVLEKTPSYRIGFGARTNSPNPPSFFIEVIVKHSTENSEVNLPRLEKTLRLLKALKIRGYSLTYQDGNCISCETTISIHEIPREYVAAKSIINTKESTPL